MNMSPAHHPEFVPVEKIDATLALEWANLSQEIEQITGTPPLRTQVVTLVVIARGSEETRQAHDLIHQLRQTSPSRAILLQINDKSTPLSARVWAHCDLSEGDVGRSYDVIEVDLCDENVESAPNLIARHKLSDVPVLVFWLGQVAIPSRLFRQVSATADRIVIDSSAFDQPPLALTQFAQFLGDFGLMCAGSDLAWRRLHIWRDLVAQSFDDEDVARLFPWIRNVEISHDPSYKAEATLLASWLAWSLDWQPRDARVRGPATSLICSAPGGRTARITLAEVAGTGVGLRSLRLVAHTGAETARITIRNLSGSHSSVTIDSTGLPRLERTVQHIEHSKHALLGEELLMVKRDPTYEGTLSLAAEFAQLTLAQGCD